MTVPRALPLCAALCLFVTPHLTPWAPAARANGRPPGTTGLVAAPLLQTPADGQTLLLGLTFGLGVSRDSGKSFHWVCEEAIGGPTGVDALLAAPSAKTLVTGSSKGLFVSRDGGCDWSAVPQFAPPSQVSALATDPHNPNRWFVAVNVPEKNRGFVYVTLDGGAHFKPLPVGRDGVYLYGVGVSSKAPNTLAVVGSNNAAKDSCLLYTSRNSGNSWQSAVVIGAPAASATPAVTLSPFDGNALLVSALDITTNGSVVLMSSDLGRTFKVVGRVQEPVRNLAFDGAAGGAFIATTGHVLRLTEDGTLAALPSPKSNACLGVNGNTLLICGSSADNQDGFALAQSHDGGGKLVPMLQLTDVQGPNCPADTSSQKICAALWPNQATAIRAAAHADPGAEFVASEQAPSVSSEKAQATSAPVPAAANAQGCRCQMGSAALGMDLWALTVPYLAFRAYSARHRRARRNVRT